MQPTPADISNLPAPIASYFAHETTDPQAVARCFAEDALVVDEGKEHRGRAAIMEWNASVTAKYSFTTEVLGAEGDTVRAKLTGNFPGSPVELRFRFTLKGDVIARLEIAP